MIRSGKCGAGRPPGTGCGRAIFWGQTPEGNNIPLDPSAPVYRVVGYPEASDGRVERVRDCFVSHFKTCPKVANFSGGGKKIDDGVRKKGS
jgi:hypothetical protein